MNNNAYYHSLVRYLGLTSNDLAELGGFSTRHARDLMSDYEGRLSWRQDVTEALDLLKDDLDVIVDGMVADVEDGAAVIRVYRDNDDLRRNVPAWPGRGHATGGFIGPHRVAAIIARDLLDEVGVEVDILFGAA